jgi:hypothetical protein
LSAEPVDHSHFDLLESETILTPVSGGQIADAQEITRINSWYDGSVSTSILSVGPLCDAFHRGLQSGGRQRAYTSIGVRKDES